MDARTAWMLGLQFFAGMIGIVGGMVFLRSGLETLAINRLAVIIQTLVKTPTRGLLTGILLTAVLHSSAAVTIITMGLVGAGSIAFTDSIGVVLGSNIGTCLTTQILAFQWEELIVPAFACGFLLFLLSRKYPVIRSIGFVLIGFAILFLALDWISGALAPLSKSPWFLKWLTFSNGKPIVGFLIGTGLTALLTSSTATTALTLALASQHLLELPSAIAIVIGNNVGTCITSVLACFGSPIASKRVALTHVAVNLLGAAVFLPLLYPFTWLVRLFAAEPGIQTATAHTLFNVISSLAIWPFTRPFAKLLTRILPDPSQPS